MLDGFDTKSVTIEGDSNRGLPRFEIIGLASKVIEESRSRIRSAIINSGFAFPQEHLIINLAPAGLYKTGTHLDLSLAMAVLALSRQVLEQELADVLWLGELGLDGQIKPIRGILSLLDYAKKASFKTVYIPSENAKEAAIIDANFDIIPVKNLTELWQNLKNIIHISPLKKNVKITETVVKSPIFDEIIGQNAAKRALTIALAGRHNLLFFGPPGSGKSAIAKCAPSLLPSLTNQERIDITRLNCLLTPSNSLANARPFRSPHNTSSRTSILGGGALLRPGDISLATHGILFLDELPEFNRDILEALRQPLEDKKITLSCMGRTTTYPSDFILLATANPCPCGYFNTGIKTCNCSTLQIANYQKRLSGPLLDRIDMIVKVPQQSTSVLVKNTTISTREHDSAKANISATISAQMSRQGKYNGELTSLETSKLITSESIRNYLANYAHKLQLSARTFFKTIRIARTIADMDNSSEIAQNHCAEALQYRQSF